MYKGQAQDGKDGLGLGDLVSIPYSATDFLCVLQQVS